MPRASSTFGFHADPSAASRPVTRRVGVVGDVQLPPASDHASQVSTVPKHRSRSRAPSTWSSSQASLVADWFGASARSWVALAMMHSPTVRRSCQPSAGAIGSPVARSHTIVLARWLVMPTAVIGSSTVSMTSVAASSTRRTSAGGVELDETGERGRRRERPRGHRGDRQAIVDDGRPDAGRADVEDEDHDSPFG